MSTPVRAGILLGALVVVWTLVMGYSGMYKDPNLANLFFVVIAIQFGVLFWALKKTAAEGRGYGGQLVGGLVISLVAAVIIFIGSYLFTTVLFPNYFADIRAIGEQQLAAQGKTPEEIEAASGAMAPMQTPLMNAMAGVVGTVVTGLVFSLILGLFLRHKGPAAPR
jgi:hypothetical protein